jgi:porphobilinogen deaminase
MGWRDRIGEYLDPASCPYAVGQGSIGIECRDGDVSTLALLRGVHHTASALRCAAERAYVDVSFYTWPKRKSNKTQATRQPWPAVGQP